MQESSREMSHNQHAHDAVPMHQLLGTTLLLKPVCPNQFPLATVLESLFYTEMAAWLSRFIHHPVSEKALEPNILSGKLSIRALKEKMQMSRRKNQLMLAKIYDAMIHDHQNRLASIRQEIEFRHQVSRFLQTCGSRAKRYRIQTLESARQTVANRQLTLLERGDHILEKMVSKPTAAHVEADLESCFETIQAELQSLNTLRYGIQDELTRHIQNSAKRLQQSAEATDLFSLSEGEVNNGNIFFLIAPTQSGR